MKEGTRILTLKRKNVIEVTEDKFGIPVTTQRNVTIPPRTGGIFYMDINAVFDTNQVLTPHTPYLQEMPTVYPHEIVVPPIRKEDDKFMHVMHITNVGADKLLYIKKGDIVVFALSESKTVQYMDVLGPECEIKQNLQVKPRNWISKSTNVPPIEVHKTFANIEDTINSEHRLLNLIDLHKKRKTVEENSENLLKLHKTNVEEEELTGQIAKVLTEGMANHCEKEENSCESLQKKEETEDQWENIQEVVESDFLTSPADIYPNRRVELEDMEISEEKKDTLHNYAVNTMMSFPRIIKT